MSERRKQKRWLKRNAKLRSEGRNHSEERMHWLRYYNVVTKSRGWETTSKYWFHIIQ